MRLQQATLLILALAACGITPPALAAQSARDSSVRVLAPDSLSRSAERAAREWLFLLDERRFESAWEQVSPAMRSMVGYEQWTTSLAQLRAVLPYPLRRELLRAEESGSLFDGNALLLSFRVGAGTLREIVVLVRTVGRWQVGGYGILLY